MRREPSSFEASDQKAGHMACSSGRNWRMGGCRLGSKHVWWGAREARDAGKQRNGAGEVCWRFRKSVIVVVLAKNVILFSNTVPC